MGTANLVDLAEIGDGDLALVGGKALGLARMVRAGLPVPPGVCITTSADPSTLGDALRERLEEYGAVAVRSSATAEDWPELSFAGQHDSVLDVSELDACIEAIRKCRRSLWSERAVAYRRRQGVRDEGLAMAVIVQRLVHAEFSGVAFTADPVTGRADRVVVEAATGLGDVLVSGRVTPERMLISKSTLSLEQRTGEGEVVQLDSIDNDEVTASFYCPPKRGKSD